MTFPRGFPLPLRFSLGFTLIIFSLLMASVVTGLDIQRTQDMLESTTIHDIAGQGNRLSSRVEYNYSHGDKNAIDWDLGLQGTAPHIREVVLLDDSARVLAAMTPEQKGLPLAVAIPQAPALLLKKARDTFTAQIETSPEQGTIIGVFPVKLSTKPGEIRPKAIGLLYLEADLTAQQTEVRVHAINNAILICMLAFLFLLLAWIYLDRVVTRRAHLLIGDTRAIAAGQLTTRSTLTGSDELAQLGTAFNEMATILERQNHSLAESERRFRTLIENAADGFTLVNEDGHYIDVNQESCKQLGYTKEEMLRLTVQEVDPDIDTQQFREIFQSILAAPAKTFETRHRRKDGSFFTVEIRVSSVLLEKTWYAMAQVRDISGRKAEETRRLHLEEQLHQAQKMESIGQLAGGVAHDFNNMLGVIIGHTELAIAKATPHTPIADHLEEIDKAANRSANITRQLLAFARKQTIAPKIINLNESIESMLKMVRRLLGEDIDLIWKPAFNPWSIRIDPTQVDQVVANLATNARDAISGNGIITIETNNVMLDQAFCAQNLEALPGKYVQLSFSDTGCGMDRETQKLVFEPFFTTKEAGKGTGLGLATIYGILKQNGGFITVDSAPSQGTTFHLYFPFCATPDAQVSSHEGALSKIKGTETILLLEDEELNLATWKQMLETLGYRVLTASKPSQAEDLIAHQHGHIDLLLTDVVMPEMNGRELVQKVQARWPKIRYLYMSGYPAALINKKGILEDRQSFIAKPFSIKELGAKVREVLSTPAS